MKQINETKMRKNQKRTRCTKQEKIQQNRIRQNHTITYHIITNHTKQKKYIKDQDRTITA